MYTPKSKSSSGEGLSLRKHHPSQRKCLNDHFECTCEPLHVSRSVDVPELPPRVFINRAEFLAFIEWKTKEMMKLLLEQGVTGRDGVKNKYELPVKQESVVRWVEVYPIKKENKESAFVTMKIPIKKRRIEGLASGVDSKLHLYQWKKQVKMNEAERDYAMALLELSRIEQDSK